MGRGSRERPTKLGKKLAQIRKDLGFSQEEMVRQLGMSSKLTRSDISKYERGVREPSLTVLLKYARSSKISVEAIIDDDAKLPAVLRKQKDSRGK